jgi:hypothetical protein
MRHYKENAGETTGERTTFLSDFGEEDLRSF